MYHLSVKHISGPHLFYSDKTDSNISFQKRSLKYLLALIPLVIILFISTSYQQDTGGMNYAEHAYLASGITDSIKSFLNKDTSCCSEVFEKTLNQEYIRAFYQKNGYRPAWISFKGLNGRAEQLISFIEHAREYGLEPFHYHFSEIKEKEKVLAWKSINSKNPVTDLDLEILLTDAAFRLMINLHSGYQAFDSALYASDWIQDLPSTLLKGVQDNEITECMISVQPRFIEYANLQKANAKYVKSLVLTDEWTTITYANKDSVVLMNQIEEVLTKLGYFKNTKISVTDALKQFQEYHGLLPDGKPGKNTIEALQRSSLYNYRILALNLDRLRKNNYSDKSILYVNIPAYRLKVLKDNQIEDIYKVIVGNPETPTPLLSGTMQKIIANPEWYVPRKIALNEILPKIKKDSTYLSRNNYRVLDENYREVKPESINFSTAHNSDFNYTIRQDRGSDNSLGQVKFLFSNPYAVYLHDTPGKKMFERDIRAFSHGCIRVQNPERLADYILHKINADTVNFTQLMYAGKHREFSIASPLKIYITYITCEADDKGGLYFYKDIYGVDKKDLETFMPLMDI